MKILVIRRDNIGDLVCTTPMIRMLRDHHPDAWIGALVTRYNAPVLAGNPHLDAVLSYQKAKHRAPGESALKLYLGRLRQLAALRRKRLDLVILPGGGTQESAARMAHWLAPERILRSPVAGTGEPLHEVERCARVLQPIGIVGDPPPLTLRPDADAVSLMRSRVAEAAPGGGRLFALHISARKPSQRWPAERFAALMRELHQRQRARFLLLWSPGNEDNPLHPGDDCKAREIAAAAHGLPLCSCPTHTLVELIAALSLADSVICSDGGAMHLAAGLGKPIVCLFGSSDPRVWHPWKVPHVVLQPASREVADVDVGQVLEACHRLAAAAAAVAPMPL